MGRQILCVDRNPKDKTIIGFGGIGWRMSLDEALAAINKGASFYVKDENNKIAYVDIIEPEDSPEYLRTRPDESMINNLESLEPCPVTIDLSKHFQK